MTEIQARELTKVFGGHVAKDRSEWYVMLRKPVDKVVTITDEAICEYADWQDFVDGKPTATIALA